MLEKETDLIFVGRTEDRKKGIGTLLEALAQLPSHVTLKIVDGRIPENGLVPRLIRKHGLADRVVAFPVEPGDYFGLDATKATVFWISVPLKGRADAPALFSESGPDATLMSFSLDKKKAKQYWELAAMEGNVLARNHKCT